VRCYKKPIIGILSTGNELVDYCETPVGSQIRDSNRATLLTAFRQDVYTCIDLGIAMCMCSVSFLLVLPLLFCVLLLVLLFFTPHYCPLSCSPNNCVHLTITTGAAFIGIVCDTAKSLEDSMVAALQKCNVVITSGGVSHTASPTLPSSSSFRLKHPNNFSRINCFLFLVPLHLCLMSENSNRFDVSHPFRSS
jgi:hypothetical protein